MQTDWTKVISKASEQDISPFGPESIGKKEEKEVQKEGESEEERVEILDVASSKTKKKKFKETTEVSTEVDKMKTKYPVEKRGKRRNT